MKNIFTFLCLIILISCSKEEHKQSLNLDFPKKEMEIEKLIAYNVNLEEQNHEKFILQFNKDKEDFFEKKVERFLDSYDSFGIFNVINRKFFKSEIAIQSEIDSHLKLIFNPIDYQKFEEKKVNEYLVLLRENRKQFASYKGNIRSNNWSANSIKFDFYDAFSESVTKNLEGAFKEQVLLYVLDGIDWILIALVLLSLIGVPLVVSGLPWYIEVGLIIITIILSFVFENIRENRIKENIMNTIKTKIISTENETLLNQLNTNTKDYYYGKN